jgi:predicted phage-related endonuclease
MSTSTVPTTAPVPIPASEILSAEQAEQRWREERKTFIGGSEIFKLLNIEQYSKGCVRALGYEKLGTEPDFPDNGDADLFERGHELEPLAAQKYERETGRKVRCAPSDEHDLPKVRRHPSFPFLGVHTDRYILAGHGDVKETGDLELKTHRTGPYIRLLREGIPVGHSLQVQHSLLVTGHSWGAFAVLQPDSWKLKHFDVPRSQETIDIIKRAGENFWKLKEDRKLADPLPDAQDKRCRVCQFRVTCRNEAADPNEVAQVQAQKEGKANLVQITMPVLEQLVADRQLLAGEIKAAEEAKDSLDERIRGLVAGAAKNAEGVLLPKHKVYLKASQTTKLDTTALKVAEPEIYNKYVRVLPNEYYRIFDR